MIPTELIEKTLALTGKTISYVEDSDYDESSYGYTYQFSIEKFCYYLLSESFIEKYSAIINGEYYFIGQEERMSATIGKAIYEYQKGNPEPIISLLQKI